MMIHTHTEDAMRTGQNEMQAGVIKNGFSYTHQCWIRDFVIQRCGHPETMDCGCFGKRHAGEQTRVAS